MTDKNIAIAAGEVKTESLAFVPLQVPLQVPLLMPPLRPPLRYPCFLV